MNTIRQRYELVRELGRGATGTVWCAKDLLLRRQVAIKLLRAESRSAAWLGRFERESWTVAQLRGPNIVQVFDAGVEDGDPFIVMELLEGESLEQRLQRHGRMSLRHAAAVLADIAKGLCLTHLAGLVHRDLKPANVFLVREGGREVVKLLDFGIATAIDAQHFSHDVSPALAGTPLYMSPEQFAGKGDAPASDVWALAVVAYQMITGRVPFQAGTTWELRQQVCAGVYYPPSTLGLNLPSELDALFAQLFSLDPSARLASPAQLAAEVMRIARGASETVVRVLVLDDEPDMELLVRAYFRRRSDAAHYELCFGRDGVEGLDILRKRPDLDIVLTDLNMPNMDGLTFLARAPELNPYVRVVVVTAYSDMVNIRAAMNLGAFDFLCKPIDFADLCATVEKAAEHARTLRHAFASGRERDLIKLLVDPACADSLLRSLEVTEEPQVDVIEVAVVWIGVRGLEHSLAAHGPQAGFAFLNAHYELAVPEVLAADGRVIRLADDGMVAVFSGVDRVRRAAEACMGVRDEAQRRVQSMESPMGTPEFGFGVEIGTVAIGAVGSVVFGRLGQAVTGDAVLRARELSSRAASNVIVASHAVSQELVDEFQFDEYAPGVYRLVQRESGLRLRRPGGETMELPTLRSADELVQS